MSIHSAPFQGAGQTFRIVTADEELSGKSIKVEDYYDRVCDGEFWTNPITMAGTNYLLRQAALGLPMNEEIVYGKNADGFGLIVHVSELEPQA